MSEAEPKIPTLDFDDLRSSDEGARSRAEEAILTGFGDYGLLYLKNHRCSDAGPLYDRFFRFTSRPLAEKEKYNRGDIWYQRGWTPPNTERAVVAGGQPDFKECWFNAPHEIDPASKNAYPEICADNVWPEDDDEFERRHTQLGRELHEAGLELLQGAARALQLEEKTFSSPTQGAPHVFRLLRYLALDQAQIDAKVLWGEEHTDFNLVTLLPGGRFHAPDGSVAAAPDQGSGLYLRTRPTEEHPQGRPIRGSAPSGCIVAQVGQELEILTGGRFLATPHVVTAPKTPGWSRMSGAHFIHLHGDTTLFPLPPFQSKAAIREYRPPVLAGTYSLKTLVDIGLAPPSALDSLGYRHYDRLARARDGGST